MAGFHAPSGGEVWLSGRCVASAATLEPPERRQVAVVFQNYALWPHLTALDTVAYPLRRQGVTRAEARREAGRILARLHVAHLADRVPAELSGGEQQRVGLARALARRGSLLLFDEPTAHLDKHVRGVFLEELVARQRETSAAALYATHDAEEALGLADRVVLLGGGRVVQCGTPVEVYAQPVDAWAARLTGAVSELRVAGQPVLIRPEWAHLGGERAGRVHDVWFQGAHTDYLLDTDHGALLLRQGGEPQHGRGDPVTWGIHRSWPGRPADGAHVSSSSLAGPE